MTKEELEEQDVRLNRTCLHWTEWGKRAKELEKENVELKTVKIPQLERKIASIRGCHRVDLEKLKARLEQVERQKQEIADLKAQIKKMKCCQNCRKFNNLSYDCTCAKVCKEWELKEEELENEKN